VSKIFADTCTINFAQPDSGQYIRIYPIHFVDTNAKGNVVLKDAFYDTLVYIMSTLPNCIFELGMHSDANGPDEKNLAITRKKAQNMMLYMIQKCAVRKKNIKFAGYGEKQLLNACDDDVVCSAEQHAVNKRMELKVIGFVSE
jgi:outer membrane protein OmpA-like peptidoglycan-associated protein